jgi:hypothetical protein
MPSSVAIADSPNLTDPYLTLATAVPVSWIFPYRRHRIFAQRDDPRIANGLEIDDV